MSRIYTVAEMVAAEKTADESGHSYGQMMELAGEQIARLMMSRYPADSRVLLLVGPGNNGGDGLVAARYLAEAGWDIVAYLFRPRPETDENYQRLLALGQRPLLAADDQRFRALKARLRVTDLVVDSLLGTGSSRPIAKELAALCKQVATGMQQRQAALASHSTPIQSVTWLPQPQRRLHLIAVDCPSGLNCDTGLADPLLLPADVTITFAGAKRGHLLADGPDCCGELVVADIGIKSVSAPQSKLQRQPQLVTGEMARGWRPERPLTAHKGSFGKALIAAGSASYWGAPLLAAKAAYRAGAGLVALAVTPDIRPTLAGQLPEAIFLQVADRTLLRAPAARLLLGSLSAYQAVLIGPGLGEVPRFMEELLAQSWPADSPPLLFDADGLNGLARFPGWWQRLPPGTVLTPHLGEMARLMGVSTAELKGMDRISLAQRQAQIWGQTVLLKGAYTVVAAADGRTAVLPFANPVLATAGSGDVLAGLIAGLLAQGVDGWQAAALGGYLHGAAAVGQPTGMLASELLAQLPRIWQALRE